MDANEKKAWDRVELPNGYALNVTDGAEIDGVTDVEIMGPIVSGKVQITNDNSMYVPTDKQVIVDDLKRRVQYEAIIAFGLQAVINERALSKAQTIMGDALQENSDLKRRLHQAEQFIQQYASQPKISVADHVQQKWGKDFSAPHNFS